MKLFIVAGNYQQAKDFARAHMMNPNDWKFVGHHHDIMGARGSLWVRVGTWYTIERMGTLEDILRAQGIHEVELKAPSEAPWPQLPTARQQGKSMLASIIMLNAALKSFRKSDDTYKALVITPGEFDITVELKRRDKHA